MPHQALSAEQRFALMRAVERLGVQRVAHELGVSRGSIATLLAGTCQPGTLALVAVPLPRLLAALEAHDAEILGKAGPRG